MISDLLHEDLAAVARHRSLAGIGWMVVRFRRGRRGAAPKIPLSEAGTLVGSSGSSIERIGMRNRQLVQIRLGRASRRPVRMPHRPRALAARAFRRRSVADARLQSASSPTAAVRDGDTVDEKVFRCDMARPFDYPERRERIRTPGQRG